MIEYYEKGFKREQKTARSLSRRALIKRGGYVVAVAGGVLLSADVIRQTQAQEPSPLSKEYAAQLSRRLYQAAEAIAPRQPDVATIQQVTAFEQEYVPHLASDGLVKDANLQFPTISLIDYLPTAGSIGVFHILGEADCRDPKTPITLNERLFTPYSPWRERQDTGLVIATVAHELAHANQVSCMPFDPLTETATQMVSMNILAGMVMEGNTVALPGFLNQMGEFADDYVLSECLREEYQLIQARTPATPIATLDAYASHYEDMPELTPAPNPDLARLTPHKGLDWYLDYLGRLPGGAQHQARWIRAFDYWLHTDWRQFNDIITKYGATPYQNTMAAMHDKNFDSPPLPIGQDQSINGQNIPLRMFSTHYVLQNMQSLVAAY